MFHRLRSKLANILMSRELEARESGELQFHLVAPPPRMTIFLILNLTYVMWKCFLCPHDILFKMFLAS